MLSQEDKEEVIEEETDSEAEAPEAAPPAEAAGEVEPVKQPANELKVVIVMRDDSIMLGVQSPKCDPVYKTFKGDLAFALKQVPGLVKEAKQKWETNPLNPKADLPEPPPRPEPVRSTSRATTPVPKAQPSFF